MKSERGFVWLPILLVIVGLVSVSGAYYVMHQHASFLVQQNRPEIPATPQVQNNPSPVPTPQQNSSGLQTYTNSQYGFTFQYPANLPIKTPSDAGEGYGAVLALPTNPAPIVTLLFNPTGLDMYGFSEADLIMRASSSVSYEDCTRTLTAGDESPNLTNTQPLTFNGQTFYKDTSGEAALGHFWNTNTYRTYYNGTCYEITDDIASSRVESRNPQASDFTPVTDAFNTVLHSFRFTAPQTIPAMHSASTSSAYKTYDGMVPVTFEYPSSFIAIDGVPDTGYGTEVDAKEGAQVGLEQVAMGNMNGWISVQLSHPWNNGKNYSNMQTSMANDLPPKSNVPNANDAYVPITLGGKPGFSLTTTTDTVMYVEYDSNTYYRIIMFSPALPQEYQTFVSSFKFTR